MSTSLTVTRWRDDRISLVALQADGVTPQNLAGCQLFFAVKLTADAEPLIAAALGAGIVVTASATGGFDLVLPPISKIGLSSLVTYFWDVLLVDAAGALSTPFGLSGTLTVLDSIATGVLAGASQAPANLAYRPDLTALTGGAAHCLDAVDTTLLSRPYLFILFIGGMRQEWEARTRADGEEPSDPDVVAAADMQFVLPDNYHAATNPVIWARKF